MDERQAETIPAILDVGDIADLLRVSTQTALRYIRQGSIPAARIVSGKYLVSRTKLIEFIDAKTNTDRGGV
jgi:excisionase family DNA binding protein